MVLEVKQKLVNDSYRCTVIGFITQKAQVGMQFSLISTKQYNAPDYSGGRSTQNLYVSTNTTM